MVNVDLVLKNGVKVWKNALQYDFTEAQKILDANRYTSQVRVENAYTPRRHEFEFTALVKVERLEDFAEFKDKVFWEKKACEERYMRRADELYQRGLMTYAQFSDARAKHRRECKKCSFVPTFGEWKSGRLLNGQRLAKFMRKIGFSKELLDFYSAQIKEEKEIFVTVTAAPQAIAGMSYYAPSGFWGGYGGTSCQDTRHSDEKLPLHVVGSLYDEHIYIAFLHEKLEDLEDLEDKFLARTLLRLVDDEEVTRFTKSPIVVATHYYGNNVTRDLLHNALEKLSELNVFSNDAINGGKESVTVNQMVVGYEYTYRETITAYVNDEYEITIDCPVCDGDGTMTIYDSDDDEHEIDCIVCDGRGRIEETLYYDREEEIEIEKIENIYTYNEGYSLVEEGYDDSIKTAYIELNVSYLKYAIGWKEEVKDYQ